MSRSNDIKDWIVRLILLLVVGLVFPAVPALAHKVTLFAWVEGDVIHTQSKFFGGKPVQNAAIEVYDHSGVKLLGGTTTEKGDFSFQIPSKEGFSIVVQAGSGHRGEWTMTKADLQGSVAAEPAADSRKSEDIGPRYLPTGGADQVDCAEIQKIVEESLEKKIAPLRKMMVDSRQNQPTVKDILGGIGYIVGIVGIAAYIRARRKNP